MHSPDKGSSPQSGPQPVLAFALFFASRDIHHLPKLSRLTKKRQATYKQDRRYHFGYRRFAIDQSSLT